jgi:5S rRNA maturation endonuclease (ribonuclease M5)
VSQDSDVLELVLGKLDGVRQQGGYWMARCPAHEDRQASLSVKRGTEQPVILHCHAGCELDVILDGIGLTRADISKPRDESAQVWTPRGDAIDVYDYTDEKGNLLFQVCRTAGKQFPQRRPDSTARTGWRWSLGDVRRVPYHLPQLKAAVRTGKTVYIVEGEKDVHAIEAAGGVATCNPGGAGKWKADYNKHCRAGSEVVIVADKDEAGRKHADAVRRSLRRSHVRRIPRIVEAAEGKDAADHLGAGHVLADFRPVSLAPLNGSGPTPSPADSNISGKPPEKPLPDVPAMTIAQVEDTYARWLHDGDKVTTRVVHAVYVANMVLGGDPVWMMLVGGSGQGKTERLAPLAIMPHVELASTLSGEAALLSATARRDRAEHAHGGLLRRIGDKGILVIKDFTSILEMDRTARGQVLAALREVYDGRWDREVGAEGGQTLTWQGKCGLLSGCTTAIDRAHAVMNDMGPRSLFLRLPAAKLDMIAGSALDHMGRETTMRAELADATAGLLTHLPGQPNPVDTDVRTALIGVASLVSQARSPVHRDWKGEIELVGDAEAPTRIIKQLGQIWRACGVLGLGRDGSWEVVRRCALDSIPKLRGAVIRYLEAHPGQSDTTTVGTGVVHPTRTVRRALEDLEAHGVVDRESAGQGYADKWELSARALGWINAAGTLPEMLEPSVIDGTCAGCARRYRPANETGLCYDCRGGAR